MYKTTSTSMKLGLDKIGRWPRIRETLTPQELREQAILSEGTARFFKDWEHRMFAEHPRRRPHTHRCDGERGCRLRPWLHAKVMRAGETLLSYAHDWRGWEHVCEILQHQSCRATGDEPISM